jgi:Glycosyltransferase like family
MISVIICSADETLLKQVIINIEQTIGVPFEIIAINNLQRCRGICEVYNEGAEKAVYPYLCFVHEDVIFDTSHWGVKVLQHFETTNVGMIGVAGGDTKSLVPSTWAISHFSSPVQIIQHYRYSKRQSHHIKINEPDDSTQRKKVLMLDGVFLCARKTVFEHCSFDAQTFSGFHGYDVDFSLQVARYFDLYVVYDIVLHHFSEGRLDKQWLDSFITLSKKWQPQLPMSVYPLSNSEFNFHHWRNMQAFMQELIYLKYPLKRVFYYYLRYSFTRHFNFRRFFSLAKYIVTTLYQQYSNKKFTQLPATAVKIAKQ